VILAHIAGVPIEEMLMTMSPVAFGAFVAAGAGLMSRLRRAHH